MKVAVVDHVAHRRAETVGQLVLHTEGLRLAVEPYDSYEVFQSAFLGADIIFLAVDGMNDIEAGRKLAQFFPQVPLVLVSNTDEYSIEAFALGACDYLIRPLGREALHAAFEHCGCGLPAQEHAKKEET